MTDTDRLAEPDKTLRAMGYSASDATGGHFHFRSEKLHPQFRTCPGCGGDMMSVGVHKIVYAYAVCDVDHDQGWEPWDHIYEQLWHRACFIEKGEAVGW